MFLILSFIMCVFLVRNASFEDKEHVALFQDGRQKVRKTLSERSIDAGKEMSVSGRTPQSVQRQHRSADRSNTGDVRSVKSFTRITNLSDVFISVKTTVKNHKTRLKLLLDTWIKTAENQVISNGTVYNISLCNITCIAIF